MKKSLLILFLTQALGAQAQDKYDQLRGVRSEDLMLKSENAPREIFQPGQKYLLVDFSPVIGSFRRFRFFPGDEINFKIIDRKGKIKADVYDVTDSSFTIEGLINSDGVVEPLVVPLGSVRSVRTRRRIPWVTEGTIYFPLAGLIYLGASFFNPGIDNQRYTLDPGTIGISTGLVGLGFVGYKLSFPNVKMNKRNKIKVTATY